MAGGKAPFKQQGLTQSAAKSLAGHLATTNPGIITSCESHLLSEEELWQKLEEFTRADPPVLLWKGHGKFEVLFKILAHRFLLAPDHVPDAERIHARWQWLCDKKKALKLTALTANLRLQHYLENNQGPPSFEDLLPHLHDERANHRLSMEALVDDEDVAAGWRC